MKVGALKVDLILQTGELSGALDELSKGLASHGVSMTPELDGYIASWIGAHTVTSIGSRVSELSRRLSEYECVRHEAPDYECEECQGHMSPDPRA